MFPLRDNNPRKIFPLVTVLLIVANVAVFYHEMTLGPVRVEEFLMQWGLIPSRDFAGPASRWIQFFSSMFLHGGLAHLLLNMWSFWIFGDNIEGAMGSFRFIIFYLLCGLAAALTHAVMEPTSSVPVVGASGAIAGVMGAYLLLYPRAKIRMFTLLVFYPLFFELPAWVFLVLWFLGQLVSGAAVLSTQAAERADVGGIAFFAHIGGAVAGLVLVPLFRKR